MRCRPATRAAVLEAVVGAMAAALWWAGRALPTPVLTSWTAATEWYAAAGPDVAVASLVRLGALAVAGWLVVATAAQLVAIATASLAARRTADLIAPRSLQRFVHGLAGFSLSAGLAVAAPSAGTPTVMHPTVMTPTVMTPTVMTPTVMTPTVMTASHRVAEPPPGTATLHLVPDAAPRATPVPVAPSAPAAPAAPAADTVVVAPGDSLWSIAEEALADAGAGDPDDRAVGRYWRRLVDANRSTLVHPGNPDLIYPGQTVVLPTP